MRWPIRLCTDSSACTGSGSDMTIIVSELNGFGNGAISVGCGGTQASWEAAAFAAAGR